MAPDGTPIFDGRIYVPELGLSFANYAPVTAVRVLDVPRAAIAVSDLNTLAAADPVFADMLAEYGVAY